MPFATALTLGFVYYLGASPWLFGAGFVTLNRPLIMGTVVGLILGDVKTGIEMGSKIQLIFMGYISAGGSMPSDMPLAGVTGTALGIMLKPSLGAGALDAGLAAGVALGMVGLIIQTGRMTWNSFYAHGAIRAAKAGNRKMLFMFNVAFPQATQATVQIIPVTIFFMAMGAASVLAGINSVVKVVLGPLQVVGQLLPCLGLALNLRAIGNKYTMPFFFLGFLLSQYLKLDIISIAAAGAVIAYLITFGKEETAESV